MSIARKLSIGLFALVAFTHLLRLLLGWEVIIDGWTSPMWISVIGVLVPASLAVMLWKETRNQSASPP